MALDLAPYFVDRDGDPLAYTAVASDPGVASVAVAGSALMQTPVGYGPASIEVAAREAAGRLLEGWAVSRLWRGEGTPRRDARSRAGW